MHIEPLESRIAPAGVVTITAAANDLRFTGDAEANAFTLENTLITGYFRVEASGGTMLRFGDQTGTSFDIPIGTKKNLLIDLGAGADDLTLTDIQIEGKLEIKGGAGNNAIHLNGLMEEEGIFYYLGGDDDDTIDGAVTSFRAASAKFDLKGGTNFMDYTDDACMTNIVGAFTVNGGGGSDTVQVGGGSFTTGGFVAKLGGGVNASAIVLQDILISGYVLAEGGGGADSLSLLSGGDLTIRKGFTANLGDGAAAVEIGAAGSLTIGGKTSVVAGNVQPSPTETASLKIGGRDVRLGPMTFSSPAEWFAEATCIVAGYVDGTGVDEQTTARSITAGSMKIQGASTVVVNATNAVTVRGSIDIKTDTGATASRVAITSGSVDIGKDLLFTDGAGDADFTLEADIIEIVGKMVLNLGDTATHEVGHIGLPGGTLTAGSITMLSRTETVDSNESITLAIAGRVETAGAFTIVDGAGALEAQFTDGDLDIGKGFTLALGSGDADVTLQGGSFTAGGPVIFSSSSLPGDVETVSSVWNFHVWVDCIVKMGAGASVFSHESDGGIARSLSIDLGAGANSASIDGGGGLRIGKLMHKSSSGAGAVLDRLSVEGVQVKEINASFGAADSILKIARSRVGKLTTNLAEGADVVRLDDNTFTGLASILCGIGADSVRIDRDATEAGASTFLGSVLLTMGAGDNEVLVADAADATKANFLALFAVYGGEDTDTFTPHATNAVFASTPVLTSVP